MFGSRLKTWMENYIGRPKKKDVLKEKSKGRSGGGGVILESSESLACSDAGISSGSQQVLSSSASDNREGYSTTTMESETSGMTHCPTTASLPSPESAYSTGYSTDGASPAGTGPPEYYINIRTGKHYFPSPAPTPTSPTPRSTFSQLPPSNQRPSASFLPQNSLPSANFADVPRTAFSNSPTLAFARSPDVFRSRLEGSAADLGVPAHVKNALSASVPGYFDVLNFSKSPNKRPQLAPMKLFLKSPKLEKRKPKPDFGNKSPVSGGKKKSAATGKSKKWFKQPFQKFGHKRADSCNENVATSEPKREIYLEGFRYSLSQESSASPRPRNRIKTNPWLPTEPLSSQNFHSLNIDFSPSLTRNRSCSNTPLQNRKTNRADSPTSCARRSTEKREEPQRRPSDRERKRVDRGCSGGKPGMESSDHSEEDLTLNEVMGTYNESYVYEKETDILSDSDPTDCDDYGTDSEAENGGDERDSHDDDLDFIDNESITESDDCRPQSAGKYSYYDVRVKKNSFLSKSDRRTFRKASRKEADSRQDPKTGREKKRQTRKSFKEDDKESKNVSIQKKDRPKVEIDENVGGLNLSRVLVQRLMQRTAPRSHEGTPVDGREQKPTRELRETRIGVEKENLERSSRDLALTDSEADEKYKELIREAESMIQSMRNSPVVRERKKMVSSGLKDEVKCPQRGKGSTDPSENSNFGTSVGKSPKNLGLNLSGETPKKPKRLDFGGGDRSSFRARSSAHSPLDPLGPALRNFSVFEPADFDGRNVSTSSSEDSETRKVPGTPERKGKRSVRSGPPVVPIAFQSVDLGRALASYCPQSEPVKRKIYSCSKTYDKLVKRFENKPVIFEESRNGKAENGPRAPENPRKMAACRGPDACLDGNQGFSQKERRKERGIPRQPSFGPEMSAVHENSSRRSFDSGIFR